MHNILSFSFVSRVCQHLSHVLFPQYALAGGFVLPVEPCNEKPSLALFKGGKPKESKPAPPPAPPVINIPAPPAPPPPPPPPAAPSSPDVTAEMQDTLKNRSKGFGYKATLLNNNNATNSATGSGSLLGS